MAEEEERSYQNQNPIMTSPEEFLCTTMSGAQVKTLLDVEPLVANL